MTGMPRTLGFSAVNLTCSSPVSGMARSRGRCGRKYRIVWGRRIGSSVRVRRLHGWVLDRFLGGCGSSSSGRRVDSTSPIQFPTVRTGQNAVSTCRQFYR
jgi:hypothetical protein